MELKLDNPSDYNSSPNKQADNVTKKTNDNGTKRQLTCKVCGEEFGKKKHLKHHLTEHKRKLIDTCNKDDSILHASDLEAVNAQDTVMNNQGLISPGKAPQSTMTEDNNSGKNLSRSYEVPKVTVIKNPSIRNVLKEEMLLCGECSKVLPYQKNLTNHMGIYTEKIFQACYICGKLFNMKSNMHQHVKKAHKINDLSQTSSSYLNIQTEENQEMIHELDWHDHNWHNKVPEILLKSVITDIIGQDEEIMKSRQSCSRFGYTIIEKWENIVNTKQNAASQESKLKISCCMLKVDVAHDYVTFLWNIRK